MAKKPTEFIEYEDGTRIPLSGDDAPEWTEADFESAKPFKEAFPELHASWKRSRGRPTKPHPKKPISFRFDEEIVTHLKHEVEGYNRRVEAIIREAMEDGRL